MQFLNMHQTLPANRNQKPSSPRFHNNSNHSKKVFCPFHSQSSLLNTIYVCVEEGCREQFGNTRNRILCSECIDEQRHGGHLILSIKKFQQMLMQFNKLSENTCEKVLQKVAILREDINRELDILQDKIHALLSFDFQNKRNKKKPYTNVFSTPQIIDMATKSSHISQWNDILRATQRGLNRQEVIDDIFRFQEQIISEQIENISELLMQNIEESMKNIEFTILNKNLLFNPDDMHGYGVGLTLNRNILEAVQAIGNQIVSSVEKNSISSTSVALTGCKLAFTEVPAKNDISRSFEIKSIKNKILLGCTDQESHQLICEEFRYQNCEKLIYGISICPDGEVITYHKSNAPCLIPQIKIKEGDIIQMAIHPKQNQVAFIQYRFLLEDFSDRNQSDEEEVGDHKPSIFASLNGNIRKLNIATINLDPEQNHHGLMPIYYPFAGVAKEGDEVKLVENIILIKKDMQKYARKISDSRCSDDDEEHRQLLDYLQKRMQYKENSDRA